MARCRAAYNPCAQTQRRMSSNYQDISLDGSFAPPAHSTMMETSLDGSFAPPASSTMIGCDEPMGAHQFQNQLLNLTRRVEELERTQQSLLESMHEPPRQLNRTYVIPNRPPPPNQVPCQPYPAAFRPQASSIPVGDRRPVPRTTHARQGTPMEFPINHASIDNRLANLVRRVNQLERGGQRPRQSQARCPGKRPPMRI